MSFEAEIAANIARAEASLQAAKQLWETSLLDDSASRSYYSAFHTATALLLSKNQRFKSHAGVLRAVGLFFIKTGELKQEFGQGLNWLAELRSLGDYGGARHITREEAEEAIKMAESFLKRSKGLLGLS